jgi:hypothetical protein
MRKIPLLIISSLLLAGCTSAPVVPGQVTPTTTPERPLPPGSISLTFSSVADFSIGSLDDQIPMRATCVVSQTTTDLNRLIARGGPQSLGDQNVDFNNSTLVSVYSGTGTSLVVQKVYEYQGTVVVEYKVITDQSRLILPVIYSPSEHITIPKTVKPVRCVS